MSSCFQIWIERLWWRYKEWQWRRTRRHLNVDTIFFEPPRERNRFSVWMDRQILGTKEEPVSFEVELSSQDIRANQLLEFDTAVIESSIVEPPRLTSILWGNNTSII